MKTILLMLIRLQVVKDGLRAWYMARVCMKTLTHGTTKDVLNADPGILSSLSCSSTFKFFFYILSRRSLSCLSKIDSIQAWFYRRDLSDTLLKARVIWYYPSRSFSTYSDDSSNVVRPASSLYICRYLTIRAHLLEATLSLSNTSTRPWPKVLTRCIYFII